MCVASVIFEAKVDALDVGALGHHRRRVRGRSWSSLPKIGPDGRLRPRPVVIVWNFGLSFFSFCGLIYCVPHLL